MKRKLAAQQGDLRKLQIEKKRSGSTTPRNSSRRGSGLNMSESEIQEMLTKLKKENYDLRHERTEMRKERDALKGQLDAAKDKIAKLEQMSGADDDILHQLYLARKEAKSQRKQKRELQANQVKLQGVSDRLRRKLLALAARVSNFNEEMGQKILNKDNANDMIDELADQLEAMISRYEHTASDLKKKEKEIKNLKKQHEEEIRSQKDKLKEKKKIINTKDARIAELEQMLESKKDELDLMEERMQESQSQHDKDKKYRRQISDLKDEI